ncbi:MAG TPA: CocE/NonD family hydrolase [Gemmatimonadales bacterium]|nr:CocE/NonD family hydrolase [Gemmatimonadales bacterium]
MDAFRLDRRTGPGGIMRRLYACSLFVALAVAAPGCAQPQPGGPPLFDRREVMIPMRDGVRLFAVIMTPRGAGEPLPILLTRTPYGAGGWSAGEEAPPNLAALAADGYVFVQEDIRGRNRSQGVFVMNRPNRAPADRTGVDESTDTWDTVEWLIHNVPGNNGKVGLFGISYPGWLAEEALIGAHPAVKAISPQAPMTDTWLGDDFFHQGAFRQSYGFEYGWGMEARDAGAGRMPITGSDTYAWYLSYPSLEALTDSTGAMRIPTWRRFVEHPAYDSVWQRRAFERVVGSLRVPTLTVGGFWDQEDLFGPQATFEALERFDSAGINHLVIGPWSHGEWGFPGGEQLGNVRWGSATSDSFLVNIQAPWFAWWLEGKGDGRFPEARMFDGGARAWRSFDRWPPREAAARDLYFRADGVLSFDPPADRAGYDAWVSDPADPVPYRPRPIEITYSPGSRWARWMTEDQRFVDGRPDVRIWKTAPLDGDVTIAGDVAARLFASTTGSDADWVVKLIDEYPDSLAGDTVAADAGMAGYELMVAGDIMRGRYRTSWERPEAIRPDAVEAYAVDLHHQLYTFRRGHRIMVQVQSTWFPLYDRNPQTFVPNIFLAPASAYRAETMRVYRTAQAPSHVEVMVVPR